MLEPLQANPVVIEDNCFIGARSEVAEGVIVGEGSVLVDGRLSRRLDADHRSRLRQGAHRQGAAVLGGRAGLRAGRLGGPALYCAVIVKTVDAQTRAKTGINELLRD